MKAILFVYKKILAIYTIFCSWKVFFPTSMTAIRLIIETSKNLIALEID